MKSHPLILLLLLLFVVNFTTQAQQTPPRGSQGYIGRQFISAATYNNLPADQQSLMLANPDKFSIEGISPNVIPMVTFNQLPANRQANIQANPQLYRLVNTVPTQPISSLEFEKMSFERRAYILANLDYFYISNNTTSTSTIATNGKTATAGTGNASTTISSSSKIVLTRAEFDNAPADKQAYINSNPHLYEITN